MEDVAKLAGVNKATVSRALKGDSRISSATREKVWEAARSLGYQPDAVAGGLGQANFLVVSTASFQNSIIACS